MTEQKGRPDQPAEPRELDDRDYLEQEERLRRALATLRLLSDPEHPSSLSDALLRARRLGEAYRRWAQSATPIKSVSVRLSGSEKTTLCRIDIQHLLQFNVNISPRAALEIWKEADEYCDEVLLKLLSLSSLPPEGLRVEETYANGQTLSLQVSRLSDEVFSISVEFKSQEDRQEAHASNTRDSSSFWKALRSIQWPPGMRYAYPLAMAAAAAVFLVIGAWRLPKNSALPSQEIVTVRAPDDRPESTRLKPPPGPALVNDAAARSSPSPKATAVSMPEPRRGEETGRRQARGRKVTPGRAAPADVTVAELLPVSETLRGAERDNLPTRLNLSRRFIRIQFTLPYESPPGPYKISFISPFGEQLLSLSSISSDGKTLMALIATRSIPDGTSYIAVSRADEAPVPYLVKLVR